MADIRVIGREALQARLDAGDVDEFWCVLTDEYFTGELIPGSRRVPLDRVGREAASLPKATAIAVYCSGPTCPQSKSAAEKLTALGFTNVVAFEGGLSEWKGAGLPLVEATVEQEA